MKPDEALRVVQEFAEDPSSAWGSGMGPKLTPALVVLRAAVAYVEAQQAIVNTPPARWFGVAEELLAKRSAAWKALLAAEAAP